jgi:flagellar hook-length control protein FliK
MMTQRSSRAAQAAGVAANAAQGLARANEVASENAQLPGRIFMKDGKAVAEADGAGDAKEALAANAAGKRSAEAQPDKPEQRAGRNVPASRLGSGQAAAATSSDRNPLAGKTAMPAASADISGGQDARTPSSVRVPADKPGESRRVSGDFANIAARPSAEPAGITFKTSGSVEILPGTADTSASRQVADAVAREMEELTPSRLSLTGSTAPGGRTVTTMRLQLNPAELGTVNIRMQSVDGELRVTIQADSESDVANAEQ